MSEFVCPVCGSDLSEQIGFSEFNDDWDCTECGSSLHRSDLYGPYEVVDHEVSRTDSYIDEDPGSLGTFMGGAAFACALMYLFRRFGEPYDDAQIEAKQKAREYRRKNYVEDMTVMLKTGLIGSLIVFLILGCLVIGMTLQKLTPVGYSSEELVGQSYTQVIARLDAAGFTKIKELCLSDLTVQDVELDGLVTEIRIGNRESFEANSKFAYDKEITVIYHTLKQCIVPISAKDVKGMQYDDVLKAFSAVGFINIRAEIDYDILTGWVSTPGEVESISINGETKFKENESVRPDARIVITYHELKSKKPD